MPPLKLLLILTALAGFLLTLYILRKKHGHQKMVCPIGGKCESVMHSEYAHFLGVPLEYIGLTYYAIIFFAYGVFFFFPYLASPLAIFILLGLTITAFLFSLYLTFIQAFTLREWCTLCLTSEGFCIVILVGALASSPLSLQSLLETYEPFIGSVYLLMLALGLGAATVADIFFLKFLKDLHISESEHDVLSTVSQVTWFALASLILSGLGIVVAQGGFEGVTPAQRMAWIVLAVTIVNSAFLHLRTLPRLMHICMGEKHDHEAGELLSIHRFIFISGAISLASWYTLFFLTTINTGTASLESLLTIYGAILIASGVAGCIMEYVLSKQRLS